MGRSVQRKGDANTFGGIILSGGGSVKVNGRDIAVPGARVTPHPPCPVKKEHCIASTTQKGASTSVRAGGKPILLTGGQDSCKDQRRGGSADVKAV
jgi:uncharacterized Zn-binding protein involved in type VI secretion